MSEDYWWEQRYAAMHYALHGHQEHGCPTCATDGSE
jgi:hypothetical protein